MAKITLDDITSGYNLTKLNENFQAIEDELNNKVLYRDNPVGEDNSLQSDIDFNSKKILNLPTPTSASEPIRNQEWEETVVAAEAARDGAEAAQEAAEAAHTATEELLLTRGELRNTGDYVAGFDYLVSDYFEASTGTWYIVNTAFTSTVEATDISSDNVQVWQGVTDSELTTILEDYSTKTQLNADFTLKRDTLSDLVTAVEAALDAGEAVEGTSSETLEYFAGTKGGNAYSILKAAGDGSRPPEDGGAVIYLAPSISEGWYLSAIETQNPQQFGFIADGTTSAAQEAAFQSFVTAHQYKGGTLPDGDYNLVALPTGIDNVHLYATPRVLLSGTQVPIFNGVFTGDSEVALVSGVIRYYTSGAEGAGWYFLSDQGQNHDPILLGPVTASGVSSLVIDVNLDTFGADPTLWEPSGFVCGPDETLAFEGVTIGASVTTETVTLKGSYNALKYAFISYNGANWVATSSNGGYTFNWVSGATAQLEVTRTTKKSAWNAGDAVVLQGRVQSSVAAANVLDVYLHGTATDRFDVSFRNHLTGENVLVESTDMQFYVSDPAVPNASFNFAAATTAGANIWMTGMLVRRLADYDA